MTRKGLTGTEVVGSLILGVASPNLTLQQQTAHGRRPAKRSTSIRQEDKAGTAPVVPLRRRSSPRLAYHSLWVITLILVAVGLLMMLSVSLAMALDNPKFAKFSLLKQQGVAVVIGFGLMLLLTRLDYHKWGRVSVLLLGATIALLVAVHLPGLGRSANGSARWIPLGPYNIQPSELAKLAIVLAGAHLLSRKRAQGADFKSLTLPFGAVAAATVLLIFLAPDMGTALIVAGLSMSLLYLAGMKRSQWLGLALTGAVLALVMTFTSHYRESRLLAFLHPFKDMTGNGYQIAQALMGLGRGGLFGQGPGSSIEQYGYLPNAHTDMILSVLGEQYGLIGIAFVILLFCLLLVAAVRLTLTCRDPLGRYLTAGCALMVTLQAIVNIGGVVAAFPLTGVPLPFISYGANDLVIMLAAVGVILSVARASSTVGGRRVRKKPPRIRKRSSPKKAVPGLAR